MVESAIDYIVVALKGNVPKELIVFITSLLPILECRGGMLAAKLLDVELWKAFIICYIGNIIPIPFVLLFARKVLDFLKRFKFAGKLAEKLESRALKKKDQVLKYEKWGLLIFVAIPLPGTGGYTGALLAALLDIRMKSSFPIIALGVLIANFIMTAVSYGFLGLFIK